eukprot:1583055-Rhodomonas_salina.1
MQVPDLLKYILAKSVEEDGGHQKVTRNQIQVLSERACVYQELKAEFKKFDKEHNGKILLEEVGTLMRVIGYIVPVLRYIVPGLHYIVPPLRAFTLRDCGREMTDFEEQSVMAELDKDGTGQPALKKTVKKTPKGP